MKSKLLLVIFLSPCVALCVPQKCILQIEADDQTTAEDGPEDYEHQEAAPHNTQRPRRLVQSYVERLIARATPQEYTQSYACVLVLIAAGIVCQPIDTALATAKNWWDMLNCLGPT